MLINGRELLKKAHQEKYAICQFNINNLEWARYILEECQANNAPVILGASDGAVNYMGGFPTVVALVSSLIKDLKITIPVILHYDHGTDIDKCKLAINAGFTSIMIDASKHEIEKNIAITKQAVYYAHPHVSVEAEVGHIGGQEDDVIADIYYATLEDCIKIVQETEIDFLAPALGSVHGLYKGAPNLNFTRMAEINQHLNLPLVLHGGSGIYDEQVKKAISLGIAKINVNTDLQIAWSKAVRKFLTEDESVYDPRKIIKAGEAALKETIKNKLILTGSINKA